MNYILNIIKDRKLILELAKNDFKVKYLGSYFGLFWAFINPIISILIYWLVFTIGFRTMPIDDFPFVLWLVAGLVPWYFISEAISNGTYSILDNSYLVKKIVFKVGLLPLIKIISSFFIHAIFILAAIILFYIYGYGISVYYIQIFYYLFASIIFVYAVSLITSSLVVFFKDLGQVVGILIQFGFWLTPIFWSFSIVPEKIQIWFKLNPIYYLVEGYRETFINKDWFWEEPLLSLYFWLITILLLIVGSILFKKLKPHFSDVL